MSKTNNRFEFIVTITKFPIYIVVVQCTVVANKIIIKLKLKKYEEISRTFF
jgi:hypothetical protein